MHAHTYRSTVSQNDPDIVEEIVSSTGFFSQEEILIARELVESFLDFGPASGYTFLFDESGETVTGYTCFGPICATASSFDLYWIAVHSEYQGKGIGQALLLESETRIYDAGGRRVYIETSSRPQYKPTRSFYLNNGYELEAVLKDFYGQDDSKCIFVKILKSRK